MKINHVKNGIELVREPKDKALSAESNVTHHLRRLLNDVGERKWVRFYPDKVGLTSCRQGLWTADKKGDVIAYWHERYQIEAAHKAFNSGSVFYLMAN